MTTYCVKIREIGTLGTLVLIAVGCAAPARSVPSPVDPANPDAEIQTTSGQQLTALTPPGPGESTSGIVDSTPQAAGHDMSAMKMSDDMGAPAQAEEHLMGVVTRVAAGSLDVTLEKGAPTVVLIDKSTKFERGEAKTNLASIKPGERIVLYATSKEGKWLARVVKLSASPTPGPARAAPKDVNASPHGERVKMPDIKNPNAQQFTCPMHPEVRSPTPGKCPKCGMALKEVGAK